MIRLIGASLFILGIFLAFFAHSPYWYTPFVIGGFLFLENFNQHDGFSMLKNTRKFIFFWFVAIAITILVEWLGNYVLGLWDYEYYGQVAYFFNVIIFGYVFTFFFGLELLVFVQNIIKSKKVQYIILPIIIFLFGYLNEYLNLFAYEWRYKNWPGSEFLGIPILVSFLWLLVLLTLPFKRFFSYK